MIDLICRSAEHTKLCLKANYLLYFEHMKCKVILSTLKNGSYASEINLPVLVDQWLSVSHCHLEYRDSKESFHGVILEINMLMFANPQILQ